MINKLTFPFAYRCPICNRQVFFFKEKPVAGETIKAANVYFEDGSQPQPGDKIQCPRVKCGAIFDKLYTKFVVETEEPKQL